MWIQSVLCRFTHIYMFDFECNKKNQRREEKPNGDTMCGNKLLPVTQKKCIQHCHQITNLV